MAIDTVNAANGHEAAEPQLAQLDASKLILNLSSSLKPVPPPESLVFGEVKTDHMLIMSYDPINGWSAPEIKPYGPLAIDPASSCLQYATNIFEGMKAYIGPDGKARLFRPDLNMKRFERSAARVALPEFDSSVLLTLIKRLVEIESRWIPALEGYSLYIRPTMIGTRNVFGVTASDSAIIYVFLSPTGPYFRGGSKPVSLLAVGENVRSWPGGTGGHKLALNYSPCFQPQRVAAKQGYDQILWLLGEDSKITEAGAMNFFVVVKRDDGDLDVITPPLDGTILPGLTRASCIALMDAHTSQATVLPGISPSQRLHTHERTLTMHDLTAWSAEGKLTESFSVGTAVIVAPIGRIGFKGKDLLMPNHDTGLGPIGLALWQKITAIQTGKEAWEDWCVTCK